MPIEVEASLADHRLGQTQSEGRSVEPDVWWSEHGIDAGLWADPPPYLHELYDDPKGAKLCLVSSAVPRSRLSSPIRS